MAACITKPITNLYNGFLITLPSSSTFTSQISYPSKAIKISSFSLTTTSLQPITRKTHFSKLISFVSDYAEAEAEVEESGEVEREEEPYPEPPEEAKLFVGNLPFDVDSEKLAQLFEQSGVVEIAEVIYNRDTDQSRGFGFVTMSTVEEAEKAVEMLHRYDLNGRLLTVNKAAPRGERPERTPRVFEPSYRLYVGNLPWDVDDARLEQVFSEQGKVVNARVVYDKETGRSRGFGFVTMETESEVNDAISNLDGQDLGGRSIRVNVAEERQRRAF